MDSENKKEEIKEQGTSNNKSTNTNNEVYPKKYKVLFFFLFCLIGLINNMGSVLIIACSQQFAKALNNPQLIALYPMAIIMCSSLTRVVNSKFCIRFKYMTRVIILSIYFLVGYLLLFTILLIVDSDPNFSKVLAFCLSLIPSFIMGTGQAFGEANILGYLRTFPEGYVSGWSTGTGFAGVVGAGISLLSKTQSRNSGYIYLYISPVTIVYFACFYTTTIFQKKAKELNANTQIANVHPIETEDKAQNENVEGEKDESLINSKKEITDVTENKTMSCTNFKEAFISGKKYIINLALVYYLEYTIYTGFGERVSKKGYIKTEPFDKYLYESFCLCYQVGVLISRSSLFIVKKIPYVEIYTICQVINYIMWLIEAILGYITIWWVLFLHLVIVGLFGGASYVGCFHFLLQTETIDKRLKELCVNIGTIFNDIGILSASITVLIVDNTFLKVAEK